MLNNSIEYIKSLSRFGSKLGLGRITELLDRLGNPQNGLRVIHVGGTNGKGSVCRYFYEVLRANGYAVCMFTSPAMHRSYMELESNDGLLPDAEVEQYAEQVVTQIDAMMKGGADVPTEFEAETATALLCFSKLKPDFVILEVGLGGAGDSTNIIPTPALTVITNVSLDHTDILGDTIEKIAADKSGIIKPGVPVITAAKGDALEVIARKAHDMAASLIDVSKAEINIFKKDIAEYRFDFRIVDERGCHTVTKLRCHPARSEAKSQDPLERWDSATAFLSELAQNDGFYTACSPQMTTQMTIKMIGETQVENAVCALVGVDNLASRNLIKISPDKVRAGLKNAKLPCRFEVVNYNNGDKDVELIFDGSHNEAGVHSLVGLMETHFSDKRVLTIVGILSDKDIDSIIGGVTRISDMIIATEPISDRKLSAGELSNKIVNYGFAKDRLICEPDINMAWHKALGSSADYDVILITGSLYLVRFLRNYINQ
jgi:dihydrofolate synthase/folylpolyglutamate synthase